MKKYRLIENGEEVSPARSRELSESLLSGYLRMNGCANHHETAAGMIEVLWDAGDFATFNGINGYQMIVELV
jgi:hypothetical protein